MLIEFKFSNYRSFRDEAVLSMEATGVSAFKKSLIEFYPTGKETGNPVKLLPSVAIYGKNGGGKSNIIRAFWLAVQFIRNAQRTQHEKASIPVHPFLLDDISADMPSSFEFQYVLDGVRYVYGFSATKTEVTEEYLFHAPKRQKALVFSRTGQTFSFRENPEKKRRQLISEAVAPNQLYFAVACTMNETACIEAMRWFREAIFFSRDYTDIPEQLLTYQEDPAMLQSISNYARMADVGIQDMKFEVKDTDLIDEKKFPPDLPEGIKTALVQFMKALADAPNASETKLRLGEINAVSFHRGIDRDGKAALYELQLSDESDGTRKLMALAPAIVRVLSSGGLLLVDELEKEMHPMLVELVVSKFQSPVSNPNHAQLIFTTHNTELLSMELLRKDQLYFVDKSRKNGASTLYSISEFGTGTNENIRKGYLMGKYGATPDLEIEEVE